VKFPALAAAPTPESIPESGCVIRKARRLRLGCRTIMPAKIIVTAAASATLGPLRRVLSELPPAIDAAMVVVQHRAAVSGSLFAKMLRDVSELGVVSAEAPHLVVRGGGVYVLPPELEAHMTRDDVIVLSAVPALHRRRSALDAVVESVVATYGPDTIALQLAGGGNWAPGHLTAVRAAGGTVLVQEGAGHPRVSRGGLVDPTQTTVTLPLSEIAHTLALLAEAGAVRHRLTGVS
jgi:chemotaxis response regulator CheB